MERRGLLFLCLVIVFALLQLAVRMTEDPPPTMAPALPMDINITPDGHNYQAPWNRRP